tara:strand:- start:7502 stop:7852 length:351 start_codon:yes stop_codon:yes gene_type:complete
VSEVLIATYVRAHERYSGTMEIIEHKADPWGNPTKAIKYLDKRNERILPLVGEGVLFRRVDRAGNLDGTFLDLDVGTAITGSELEFLKSGMHIYRTAFEYLTPWVFTGTAGYGYGI